MKTDQDYWTIDAMIDRGGSFVHQLGELAARADAANLDRIKNTWPEYWAEYEAIGKEMQKQNGV